MTHDSPALDFLAQVWRLAGEAPETSALRVSGRTWTYGDLARSASRRARELTAAGLQAGDRVLLVAPTGAAFVQSYLGALAAGAVVVPANPLCTARELGYYADDAGARLVVASHDCATHARAVADRLGLPFIEVRALDPGDSADLVDPEPRDADAPAVLLYTSGTTGQPKGATVTWSNIGAATSAIQQTFNVSGKDRVGTALPLFHVFGQVAVLAASLAAGASVSLLRPFSGEAALRMAERDRLTVLCGVPTMWIEMLESARTMDPPPVVSSLRLATSGGAALPTATNRAFADEFGAHVQDGYGLSETTGIATFHRPWLDAREGSVGQAAPGVDLRIIGPDGNELPAGEIGEIAVAGANIMAGYWERPEATAAAVVRGRLLTGDLGRLDDDGYLWVVGRSKELIIRGGYNVYPREVEDALHEHPAVLEAAVVGVPDERLGEEIAAVVAFRAGSSATPEELRAWLDERVAAYKAPRLYHLVASLPKGPTGKVHKIAIDRSEVAALASRPRPDGRGGPALMGQPDRPLGPT